MMELSYLEMGKVCMGSFIVKIRSSLWALLSLKYF